MKRQWYTLFLTGSLIIAAAVWMPAGMQNGTSEEKAAVNEMKELSAGLGSSATASDADQTAGGAADETGSQSAEGGSALTPPDASADANASTGQAKAEGAGRTETSASDTIPSSDAEPSSGGADEAQSSADAGNQTAPVETGGAPEGQSEAQSTEAEAQSQPQGGGQKLIASDAFDGVLLIGDSRTLGLADYGNVGNAEVFAGNGVSVFQLFKKQEKLRSGGTSDLASLLKSRKFNTIFLMLGINELGYPANSLLKGFQSAISEIRSLQPDATFVIEANFHVTAAKSASSDVFNNERINTFNGVLQQLAAQNGCLYRDPNPIYDDGNGNMAAEYSGDGVHVKVKYYGMWRDWLLNQTQ